jgi:spermidine synthase
VSWLGYFYGGNLAGRVAGSLLAGFYLLRVFDMAAATVRRGRAQHRRRGFAMLVARVTPHTVITADEAGALPEPPSAETTRIVYIAIALSGLTALGSEVVWTRQLSLIFGATAYTFSLILAVFLVGLGIGSSLGSALARTTNARTALGWCQLGLCAALAWAGYTTSASMPYWPINPSINATVGAQANVNWIQFQLDLMRAAWVMLPGAILWGASFPLALAGVASPGQDSARLVGGVYAANTVGAIVGALVTSLVLVGTVGTQMTQQVLIGVAAMSGLLMLMPATGEKRRMLTSTPAVVIGIALVAGLLARAVPPIPWLLVAYWPLFGNVGRAERDGVCRRRRDRIGRCHSHTQRRTQLSQCRQGAGVERTAGHAIAAHARAHHDARTENADQGSRDRMRGGRDRRRSFDRSDGQGSDDRRDRAARAACRVHALREHNFNCRREPEVHVHLDDARHYLLTTNEKFDAVTSDPLDPWVKGAATLYTREFFEVVKSHLNPGGVVTLFVQLYESNEAAVKSEVATFLEAFPNGAVFANTINGQGYDLVLFGQVEGRKINVDTVQARLTDPANAAVAKSLGEVGINSAVDLFGTYAGRRSDMKGWLSDAQINTDRNLKLQYLAGLGLNLYQSDAIYKAMIKDSKYPDDLFEGSPETLASLRSKINSSLGGSPSF